MQESLTRQGIADSYVFTRPAPPPRTIVLNTFTAINATFNDPTRFKSVYELHKLGNGYGFFVSDDDKPQ